MEAERINVPGEEAPSLSPEQSAAHEAEKAAERFEQNPTDLSVPTQQNAPTTEEVNPDRPGFLPEKFSSAEELAEAYKELENKLGGNDLPPEMASNEALQQYANNFAENGELSEDDYAGLSKMGIARDVVDTYIQGQMAMQDAEVQAVFNEVGGSAVYQDMVQWAADSLSPEEVSVFDADVQSGDKVRALNAVRGLQARYSQVVGIKPTLVRGHTQGSGTSAYSSLSEMKRDMGDPRYQSDPAFREQVTRRLSVSNIM
jgi:hypothetical protein